VQECGVRGGGCVDVMCGSNKVGGGRVGTKCCKGRSTVVTMVFRAFNRYPFDSEKRVQEVTDGRGYQV